MRLRIAQVTATFPPYLGGTGNVCFHNSRELVRRGHAVHVFTPLVPGTAPQEVRDGIVIRRPRPRLRVGNASLLPGLLRALHGFDIVHLHYPFYGGEWTALAARRNRIPLVITYHQDVTLHGSFGVLERLLRHTTGRLTLRTAEQICFTSFDYARASHARPLLRGREHTIDELPNGVDVATFRPGDSPAGLRARYQIAPDAHVALLVAGLDRAHYFKGVNVFLVALAQLPPNVHSVLVGDGNLRANYEAMAHRLGIASRVVFAGRVQDEDLPGYYQLADVTVLPSVTSGEAFGLVLVESLASATPVIATNLPGVRTVVDHGWDGLLVEPDQPGALAEAIRQIVRDRRLRQEMGQRGRAKVEARYDWRQIGDHLEAIYQRVLDPVAIASSAQLGRVP